MGRSARTRGPNKQPPWTRTPEHGVSVLRLALDTSDPLQRRGLEAIFSGAFSIRRALQREVRSRVRAYRAAFRERSTRGTKSVRERLGLTRESLERRAYRHLDRAPHLRRFVTKALAMHIADSVWTAAERHLFADASGKRSGVPHVGRWFDFARLPGRARSHTRPRKWETFRLHGTLAGHRDAYRATSGRFFQPRRMRPVSAPADSWWSHRGPLVIVFSGLGVGDLVLPVRLPAAPSNQPILDHHLSDAERWHKIDLVRRRDPNVAGGWRYEAHLMVLVEPYVAPATKERRARAARETTSRRAGIDVNVSNVTIASHVDGEDLRITRVARDADARETARSRARRERRRQRALERSRRAANPDQYELSPRQRARAREREALGLPPQNVIPRGPRKARADGRPLRAFRKDRLSKSYRYERAKQTAEAAATSRARKDHARRIAGELVLRHGFRAAIEQGSITAWARRWGRSLAAFSPGTLVAAIRTEMSAAANIARASGGLLTAATQSTALSQHCLCGARVTKTLDVRIHRCPSCGLLADRDAMSATLATFVEWRNPAEPATAFVDFGASWRAAAGAKALLERTIVVAAAGRQDAPSEPTALPVRDGVSVEDPERSSPSEAATRRTTGTAPSTTPDETDPRDRTTPERARKRTGMSQNGEQPLPQLRDSS